MADKQTRMKQILDILSERNSSTIKLLAGELGVSEMTVRRDVAYLEKSHFVNVFYGGLSLNNNKLSDVQNFSYTPYSYDKENMLQQAEKKRIGQFASTFIEPFDAIAIDNGTTCRHILDHLEPSNACILYTYSMEVLSKALQLQNDNIRLFVFGGHYHKDLKMFESLDTVDTIKKTHINKLFLGAVGVSSAYGISCSQRCEVDIRRALLSVSEQVFLLADSSKIDKSWHVQYGDLSDIDVLITDNMITEKQKAEFEAAGITVYIV